MSSLHLEVERTKLLSLGKCQFQNCVENDLLGEWGLTRGGGISFQNGLWRKATPLCQTRWNKYEKEIDVP